MNKLIDFLKRYYRCTFDFNIFQSYLKEPTYKALLFLLPLFLIFTFQSYFSALSIPKDVIEQVDGYYQHIQGITQEDINTSGSSYTTIEASFDQSEIKLDQNKIYDTTFNYKGENLRLIIDTQNTNDIKPDLNSKYNSETQNYFVDKSAYMVAYIGGDFIIINIENVIHTYKLDQYTGNQSSIKSMVDFVKSNYIDYGQYLILAFIVSLVLYAMYYLVDYFIVKSFIKRKTINVSKSKLRKVVFYSMQPGMYVYLLLNIVNSVLPFDINLVIPLLSMLAMYYVATKTVNQMEIYIKKEKRKTRKQTLKNPS